MTSNERGGRTASNLDETSGFNFWGLAAKLVDDVKKNTESFVSTIAETDWTKELSDIKQSLQEDTQQLESSVLHLAQREHEELPERPPEAHGEAFSLAKFGQSLMTGTREWIEQVKTTVDADFQAASKDVKKGSRAKPRAASSTLHSTTKYSRLDSEISSMQRNSGTYCDEPEDEDDFAAFMATFDLQARKLEIDTVLSENAFMAELHSRIVPLIVEHEVFWQRYFYRLHKLVEQHEKHRNLVLRANQMDASDISWDDETPSSPSAAPARTLEEPDSGAGQAERGLLIAAPLVAAGAALATAAVVATEPVVSATVAAARGGTNGDGGEAGDGAAEQPDGADAAQSGRPRDADDDVARRDDSLPRISFGAASGRASGEGDVAAAAGTGRSSAAGKARPADCSGHTSSDWSIVSSSPSPNTPAEEMLQPTVAGESVAPAQPAPAGLPPPMLPPPSQGKSEGAKVDEADEDDLDLGPDAPGAAAGEDEELDEDWGEWD